MPSVTCLVKKEGNQYASLCLELDIASCGRTPKEAVGGLKKAIEAYLLYELNGLLDSQLWISPRSGAGNLDGFESDCTLNCTK